MGWVNRFFYKTFTNFEPRFRLLSGAPFSGSSFHNVNTQKKQIINTLINFRAYYSDGLPAKDADTDDNRLGAWYHHWEALAYDLAGNEAKAAQAYLRAANERAELGRPQIRKGVVVTSGDNRTWPAGKKYRIVNREE